MSRKQIYKPGIQSQTAYLENAKPKVRDYYPFCNLSMDNVDFVSGQKTASTFLFTFVLNRILTKSTIIICLPKEKLRLPMVTGSVPKS